MKAEIRIEHWSSKGLLPVAEVPSGENGISSVNFLEGIRAFCEGDLSTARRKFSMILVGEAENYRAMAACGHAWLHEGNREKALDYYRRAEIAGEIPEVQYNRALIYSADGRWSEALPLLKKLYNQRPSVQKGRFYFGLLFGDSKELLCEVAIYLGLIHQNLDRNREAHDWYSVALEHNANSVPAHQRLAEIEILSKSYVSAINHLRRVLEISPLGEDKVHAHNNLGIALYENGQLDDAIAALNWVLRHAPGNPSAIHNLNYIYEAEGILDREDRAGYSIRFMDVKEGASPIFGLTSDRDHQDEEHTVMGKSSPMLRVMRHARVAAASDSTVVIVGARGTGKELLAKVITQNSSRADGPFKVVSCHGKQEVLLESELFGHEKGAYTGAKVRRQGVLETCSGGTVLIKDIEALSPLLQNRLLRALREGTFSPAGGVQEIPLNVRLIVATCEPLKKQIERGALREDLFYEINIIPIELPPLVERRDDMPLLMNHFTRKYSRNHDTPFEQLFSPEDASILMEYDWPGNVRELENFVARAVVMGSQSNLYMEELAQMRRHKSARPTEPSKGDLDNITYPLNITLSDLERRHILSVLELNENNQRKASKILGINPSTLWRKLKNYEGE